MLSSNPSDKDTPQQTASSNTPQAMASGQTMDSTGRRKNMHEAMHAISGDDAYKQNCTRCHSEVPQRNTRATTTILRHMRVRANLTQDEAKAILEYLTQ